MQYLIQNLNRQHWIAVVDKKTYHVITFFGLVAQVVCCYYCNNISSMWTMTFYRRQLATHLMETNSTFLIYGIYSLERWNIYYWEISNCSEFGISMLKYAWCLAIAMVLATSCSELKKREIQITEIALYLLFDIGLNIAKYFSITIKCLMPCHNHSIIKSKTLASNHKMHSFTLRNKRRLFETRNGYSKFAFCYSM